jgi:dolichol-phosphate mannosyltransferase
MIKLDIVIPVYNEAENILQLLKAFENEINCNFRVLICYDKDDDTTLKKLEKQNSTNKEILLIKNPKHGPNSAIIQGINLSKAEIILIYMADDFENVKLINKMVNLIEQGYHLIIPSRFVPGGKMKGAKKIKKIFTVFGSYLIYYIARIPFKDCTNAFKMFSAKLKKEIEFNSTKGFTFALELTAKSYFLNLKIIEIPSIWVETNKGKSNFKFSQWLPYYIYWLIYSLIKNFFIKHNVPKQRK